MLVVMVVVSNRDSRIKEKRTFAMPSYVIFLWDSDLQPVVIVGYTSTVQAKDRV